MQDEAGIGPGMALHILVSAEASMAWLNTVPIERYWKKTELMAGTAVRVKTYPGKRISKGVYDKDTEHKSVKDLIQARVQSVYKRLVLIGGEGQLVPIHSVS